MNRYDNPQATYVPATTARRMNPAEAAQLARAIAAGPDDAGGIVTIPADPSQAWKASEGILDRTSATDRAKGSLLILAPWLGFNALLVGGLVMTTGLPWKPAIIVYALLVGATYAILHERNLAHSRPGIERLKVRSAERLEIERMNHAAGLQKQRQDHEARLADKALEAYVRAQLGEGDHE